MDIRYEGNLRGLLPYLQSLMLTFEHYGGAETMVIAEDESGAERRIKSTIFRSLGGTQKVPMTPRAAIKYMKLAGWDSRYRRI